MRQRCHASLPGLQLAQSWLEGCGWGVKRAQVRACVRAGGPIYGLVSMFAEVNTRLNTTYNVRPFNQFFGG
jgi:hypothetical protein